MDRFTEMTTTTFVSVVDAGSLSAHLASSLPAVNRQLTALESRLGTKLVHRTTRKLRLTEAGEAFYGRCIRILVTSRMQRTTSPIAKASCAAG